MSSWLIYGESLQKTVTDVVFAKNWQLRSFEGQQQNSSGKVCSACVFLVLFQILRDGYLADGWQARLQLPIWVKECTSSWRRFLAKFCSHHSPPTRLLAGCQCLCHMHPHVEDVLNALCGCQCLCRMHPRVEDVFNVLCGCQCLCCINSHVEDVFNALCGCQCLCHIHHHIKVVLNALHGCHGSATCSLILKMFSMILSTSGWS